MMCERIGNIKDKVRESLNKQKGILKDGLMYYRESEEAFWGVHFWGRFIDKWIEERDKDKVEEPEPEVSKYHIRTL